MTSWLSGNNKSLKVEVRINSDLFISIEAQVVLYSKNEKYIIFLNLIILEEKEICLMVGDVDAQVGIHYVIAHKFCDTTLIFRPRTMV